MMASRSSCDQVLNIVLMISRNFSLSKTLGSSFLKYWMKSYKIKYVPENFLKKKLISSRQPKSAGTHIKILKAATSCV
jgi:hypothetical protein